MREYAEQMQGALIRYERELMKNAHEALTVLVERLTDDELREMSRSGKLDLFMQKTLFNIIRKRREEKGGFRKFLDKVTGK